MNFDIFKAEFTKALRLDYETTTFRIGCPNYSTFEARKVYTKKH
jgi:hypothetical protein